MDNFFRNTLENSIEITELITVHYFKYARNFRMDGEIHAFFELVYVDSGKVDIVNGEQNLSLCQGEGFIHRPNIFHSIKASNDYANIIVVTFDGKHLSALNASDKVFTLNQLEKQLLLNIVEQAEQSFVEPLDIVELTKMTKKENLEFGALQLIKNYIEILLLSISRKFTNQVEHEDIKASDNNKKFIYEQVIAYLNKNLHSNITLKQLSDEFGYSIVYLNKIFNSFQGSGIIYHHLMMKIEQAKRYIAEDIISFSDISHNLAFASPQYFSRIFKSFTNMTPSQYKHSVKKSGLLK